MVRNAEARTVLNVNRIRYWLSVGAQPSEKVQALLNKLRREEARAGRALGAARAAAAGPGRRRAGRGACRDASTPRRPPEPIGARTCRSPMSAPSLRFDVLTLFPGLFDGFLGESILKRAIDKGLVEVERWDIRDWAEGKHKQVDDRPFGGGPAWS